MAAIDYKGIRDALEDILSAKTAADEPLDGARVYIEEEPQFGLSDNPAIAVFLDTRTAPDGEQSISRGTRTRLHLRGTLWVVAFSLDSYRKACDERDALLGQVELILMANRTLNEKVSTLWLNGGELFSARNPQQESAYVSVGEVIMTMDVSAINT